MKKLIAKLLGLYTTEDVVKEIGSLKSDLSWTQSLLEISNKDNAELLKSLDTQRTRNFYDYSQTDKVVIDFNVINAVSIERRMCKTDKDDLAFFTIIGYWSPDDQTRVKEWFLQVSEKKHAQLVREFTILRNKRVKGIL